MELDDSDILQMLKTADERGVSEFLAGMRPHIRKMVERRIDPRVRSRLDASDITQEALLRAAKALPEYLQNPTVHPVVWLRIIGKRVAAEAHRKQFRAKRSPNRELDWENASNAFLLERIADSKNSVAGDVIAGESHREVLAALGTLAPTDREIIEMRHLEQMSMTEAAEALGLKPETAKKRYYRALKKLRGHLVS